MSLTGLQALDAEFLLRFFLGFRLNLTIAAGALFAGLFLGFVLAWLLRLQSRALNAGINLLLTLCRATPTFIALFFLAGVVSEDRFNGLLLDESRLVVLCCLACLPYIVSYASDEIGVVWRRYDEQDFRSAVLLIPSLGRVFQVLLATSCLGAAIGVPEAMSAVLFTADTLSAQGDRLVFFGAVTVLFIVVIKVLIGPFRLIHALWDAKLARLPEGQT